MRRTYCRLARLVALATTLLAPCVALAQTVSVANYSSSVYDGWVPVSTAHAEALEAGRIGSTAIVPGRRVGAEGRIVHLHTRLDPGQVLTLDLSSAVGTDAAGPAIPPDVAADPIGTLGRPRIGGMALDLVELTPDGPSYLAHFRRRLSELLVAELWVSWYPDQPWSSFELLMLASNASSAQTHATIPAGFDLTWDPGHVVLRGHPGGPLLAAGETLGDGQGRAFSGTVFWTGRLRSEQQWRSAGAWAQVPTLGQGDWFRRFGPLGAPAELPQAFRVADWFRRHASGEIMRLNSWQAGPLGVAANSSQTGAQEDQGFTKASEAFAPGGTGAWWARYPAALGFVRRPCHHLEASGLPLDLQAHPSLVFWSGRPHWHTGVSRDQLGLPAGASIDWHGWYGPDRGHWLINNLGAVRLLSGSPALEYLLQHQARVFWFGETVKPSLSTSHAGTARAVGWTALAASWIYLGLDDRDLAEQVKSRFVERLDRVLVPELSRPGMQVKRWDPRTSDARLWEPIDQEAGYTAVWMPYQQAVGACGLQIAGELFDLPRAQQLALEGALAVVDYGYTFDEASGRWLEWDFVAERQPGEPLRLSEYVEGRGAHRTGWFAHAWSPMAAWVVLRHDPQHARARAIYDQVRREMLGGDRPLDWLPRLGVVTR